MSSNENVQDQKEYQPRIVAFLCNWCSYAGADLAGVSRLSLPTTIRPIRVMCSSRVNPLWIIRAHLKGADGVLVAGCHPNDCHYQRGNFMTRRRFALVRNIFESLDIGSDRFRLSWISASEGAKYQKVTEEITEETRGLGKNPARKEIFL
jgi:F420-non-reducing hydrogenase iron-sulfur subunit